MTNNIIPMQRKKIPFAQKLRHWLDEKNKPAPKKPMATRTGPRTDRDPPSAA